jgi:hypothetical protein
MSEILKEARADRTLNKCYHNSIVAGSLFIMGGAKSYTDSGVDKKIIEGGDPYESAVATEAHYNKQAAVLSDRTNLILQKVQSK